MKKTVWVLYRYNYFGTICFKVVSKNHWQKSIATYKTRNFNRDVLEYLAESNDKAVLEQMMELAKEQ